MISSLFLRERVGVRANCGRVSVSSKDQLRLALTPTLSRRERG